MRQWQFYQLLNAPRRLIVTRGKHKGLIAEGCRRSSYGSEVWFEIHDVEIPYKNVEWVRHDNEPDLRGMMDMTGRDIDVGTWVVYSIPAGSNSHALEMGKVVSISDTGTLLVDRALRNGDKAEPGYRNKNTRRVNDANRCLTLPVDEATMVTWVLKGFTDLKDET